MSNRSERKAEREAAKNLPTPPDPDHDIAPLPQPEMGETNADKRTSAPAHPDTAVHARDVETGRRTNRADASPADVGSALREGEVEGKPKPGAVDVFFRGQHWGPIACGVHRSPEVFEHSTDDKPAAPDGFQPDCEACKDELSTTIEHALRYTHMPPVPIEV